MNWFFKEPERIEPLEFFRKEKSSTAYAGFLFCLATDNRKLTTSLNHIPRLERGIHAPLVAQGVQLLN